MDVHCVCGEVGHIDAEFAYFIRCGNCGRIFEVGGDIKLHEITEDELKKGSSLGVEELLQA